MTATHPAVPPYPLVADHVVVEIRADRARPAGRLVLMDGVEASHVDLADPTWLEFEYLRHATRLIDAVHPRRGSMDALQVGGGPCTLARYLTATRRSARVTVVERDAGVVRVAREWLGLKESPRLRVVVGEGRAELARWPDASLDLLVIDAFVGVVVPHALVTAEFTAEARRVLRPGGLHLVNLIDIPPLGLAAAAAATMAAAYANVAVLVEDPVLEHRSAGNLLLAASDRTLPAEGVARAAARDPAPWRVLTGRSLGRLLAGAPVLRDDEEPQHALATLAPLWGRLPRASAAGAAPVTGRGA